MTLIHLDTDYAGDTDDACALAMLLGRPDAEIAGITTVADPDGQRAGYAAAFLELAHRTDIAVVAGAGASLAGGSMGGLPDHSRYWGHLDAPARPGPPVAALDLLAESIERAATVIAIGPYTNLARLEQERPGTLGTAHVVAMGGWVDAPEEGFPQWGPEMDWNVQADVDAAEIVFAATGALTLATLPATMAAHLRRAHLPRLQASGPLGALLARQAVAHAEDNGVAALAAAHPALPDDLCNFQWDPAACAVALGWDGAVVESMTLAASVGGDGVLRLERADHGRPARVLTRVDGDAFAEEWLRAIERAEPR